MNKNKNVDSFLIKAKAYFDNIQVPIYKQYPVTYDQDVYLIMAYFCEPVLHRSDNTCYFPNI